MKTLNNYIKESNKHIEIYKTDKIITFEGLDKEITKRISNLEGQHIFEYYDEEDCCAFGNCGQETIQTSSYEFISYYSENEVVSVLNTCPKVQHLINIQSQFGNRFKFSGDENRINDPIYFTDTNINTVQKINLSSNEKSLNLIWPQYNKKLYDFIKDLSKTYKLNNPVVLTKNDNSVQLFFSKYTETNKTECSIKNSLSEIVKILNKFDSMKEITWSQVLDISIDNIDNVYAFVLTCTINSDEFTMTDDQLNKILDKIKLVN